MVPTFRFLLCIVFPINHRLLYSIIFQKRFVGYNTMYLVRIDNEMLFILTRLLFVMSLLEFQRRNNTFIRRRILTSFIPRAIRLEAFTCVGSPFHCFWDIQTWVRAWDYSHFVRSSCLQPTSHEWCSVCQNFVRAIATRAPLFYMAIFKVNNLNFKFLNYIDLVFNSTLYHI